MPTLSSLLVGYLGVHLPSPSIVLLVFDELLELVSFPLLSLYVFPSTATTKIIIATQDIVVKKLDQNAPVRFFICFTAILSPAQLVFSTLLHL